MMWSRTCRVPDRVPVGAPLLEASAVSVTRSGTEVLSGADLSVAAGEVVALVGPNGAGKSTFLGALSGELHHDGQILLAGRPLGSWSALELARLRAVLPQSFGVSFPFKVSEVVRMGRSPWAHTVASDDDEGAVSDAMAAADVTHLAQRPVTSLSGGERARVGLARVIAQATQLLLLDEPTASLDLAHQEQVLALASGRARLGDGVVVVLHDLALAAAHAERVALLDGGRVAAVGTPREVMTAELLSSVYRHPVEVFEHPHRNELVVLPMRPSSTLSSLGLPNKVS